MIFVQRFLCSVIKILRTSQCRPFVCEYRPRPRTGNWKITQPVLHRLNTNNSVLSHTIFVYSLLFCSHQRPHNHCQLVRLADAAVDNARFVSVMIVYLFLIFAM